MTGTDTMHGFHFGEPCEGCGECVPVTETYGGVVFCVDCVYIQCGVHLNEVV